MGRIREFFGEFEFFPTSEASYYFVLPSTRILPARFYEFNETVFNRFFEEYAVFLGHQSAEDYIRALVEERKKEGDLDYEIGELKKRFGSEEKSEEEWRDLAAYSIEFRFFMAQWHAGFITYHKLPDKENSPGIQTEAREILLEGHWTEYPFNRDHEYFTPDFNGLEGMLAEKVNNLSPIYCQKEGDDFRRFSFDARLSYGFVEGVIIKLEDCCEVKIGEEAHFLPGIKIQVHSKENPEMPRIILEKLKSVAREIYPDVLLEGEEYHQTNVGKDTGVDIDLGKAAGTVKNKTEE